jgi:hypothetical protein
MAPARGWSPRRAGRRRPLASALAAAGAQRVYLPELRRAAEVTVAAALARLAAAPQAAAARRRRARRSCSARPGLPPRRARPAERGPPRLATGRRRRASSWRADQAGATANAAAAPAPRCSRAGTERGRKAAWPRLGRSTCSAACKASYVLQLCAPTGRAAAAPRRSCWTTQRQAPRRAGSWLAAATSRCSRLLEYDMAAKGGRRPPGAGERARRRPPR